MARDTTERRGAAAALTWTQVLAWRAARQHLRRRVPAADALRVVSDLGGLHAQVMSSAELTLWARTEGLARDWVQQALWAERTLVKTWAMRGTLHLLPAAELPLWVAAQSAIRPRHETASWLRHHRLTRDEADALLAAIPVALEGRALTREELAEAVAERSGVAHAGAQLREGFGSLLKPAAFRGDLCFAPGDGRKVRFAHPAHWLGAWSPVAADDAAGTVARRYLAAYGPATRQAFARWFGMSSAPQAERLLRRAGASLVEVAVEGTPAFLLAEHVAEVEAARPAGSVRLLPAFDHHVIAAPRDVGAVLATERRRLVYRPQGWLSPVLLVDGRIAGVWRHERKGSRLVVDIEPFTRAPTAVRRGAEAEAQRLAGFLGGELELRWG